MPAVATVIVMLPLSCRIGISLESGAEQLPTDFPPREPDTSSGYTLNFGNGETIRRNPVIGQ